MKKMICTILAALLLLAATGCSSREELDAAQGELAKTQGELVVAQAENMQLKAQMAELEDAARICTVYALHATIDGQTAVQIDGETELTAQAVLAEGQVVDYWELNGEIQADATGETFCFTAAENATVEAVLRDERKVTTINCELCFLDEDGNAAGDSYEEFVFETPYQNPVTGEEITDGTITIQITAQIPNGYTVDYWKINGVEYRYTDKVSTFQVTNLDEATEYEVVLKEKPQVYYKVSCSGCTINGQSVVYVLPGSTVTASAGRYSGYFYVNGVQYNSSLARQVTFTVNCDTRVNLDVVIN